LSAKRARARARCPSPVELERAFWSDDPGLRAHAAGCERCGREWAEIAALVETGRAIPPPAPSPERREEIRTALLSAEPNGEKRPDRRARWLTLGGAAAAAALAVAWLAWPSGDEALRVERGRLLAHAGARYLRVSPSPDEIVRLVDGTVTVEVERLQPGEGFRIVTGDAEVEVRGTAFDVTAAGDRLRSVRVIHGSVEVRARGSRRVLSAGQTWPARDAGEAGLPAGGAAGTGAAGTSGAGVVAEASAAGVAAGVPAAGDRGSARPGGGADAARPRSGAAGQDRGMRDRNDRGPMSASRAAVQQAYDQAWAALRAGAFDRAAAAFERAAARDRTGSIAEDARYWRAVALARGGQAPAAKTAFETFLADHADSPRAGEASVMLGWLLFDDGNYQAAARRFRAGAADPSDRIRTSAAKGLSAIRRAEK
jgi:TolA-binding protein